MTLVSQIITDAYRQSNLLPIAVAPTVPQQEEGLRYLSRLVKSVFGQEMSELLDPFPIGSTDIERPSGWPWYVNVPPADWFVPENTRLMANLSAESTVYLHPQPDDGARLGVIDVAENFSANPLTLSGNGRRIEGLTDLVLNLDGTNKEWFYRTDLGEWVLTTPLLLDSEFPFPEEFDFYFITLLAMTINPAYGVQMDQQTATTMTRAKKQFQSRYRSNKPTRSEIGITRMPKTTQQREYWDAEGNGVFDPSAAFKAGWPF